MNDRIRKCNLMMDLNSHSVKKKKYIGVKFVNYCQTLFLLIYNETN